MIVSTISLVAVIYFLWQLIGPPITSFINQIQYGVSVNRSDYNFAYPGSGPDAVATETTQTPAATLQAKQLKPNNFLQNLISRQAAEKFLANSNYNFAYSDYRNIQSSPRVRLAGIPDEMLNSNQIKALADKSVNYETDLSIRIPSQEIAGLLLAGYDYKALLTKGFWVYPGSYPIGQGTVVVVCQRRQFLPLQSHSCWYADQIKAGDEIIIYKGDDIKATYVVTQSQVLPSDRADIYAISEANVLKLVTAQPLGANSSRLVIMAVPK
jgi:LPXTG-site transpeptidase (sortase) family protein